MKVLQVNDYRCGKGVGGCEVVMETTVSLLRAAGIDVEVFTSDDVESVRPTPLSYIDSRRCGRALARVMARFRPDVVHLHNFYHVLSPGILAVVGVYRRDHRLRVVMTAHDYHLACPNAGLFHVRRGRYHHADVDHLQSLAYLLSRRWDERSVGYSLLKTLQHLWNYRVHDRRRVIDCILCPSRFLRDVVSRLGLATALVPYPIPDVRQNAARPTDELELVFAGRVEREKGVAEFLELMPADFSGRLTIVGEGSQLKRCRAVCRHRGLESRVDFAGRLPRADVLELIGRSHVLVLPSLWVENHPMSLLEALACGTSILVSDLGGMREIVDDSGVGFTFAPGDAAGLAASLEQISEAFRAGTLNGFDASAFLDARSESRYLDAILATYV